MERNGSSGCPPTSAMEPWTAIKNTPAFPTPPLGRVSLFDASRGLVRPFLREEDLWKTYDVFVEAGQTGSIRTPRGPWAHAHVMMHFSFGRMCLLLASRERPMMAGPSA